MRIKRAAAFMLIYAQSSVFEEDVKRLRDAELADTYLRVARTLIDGGYHDVDSNVMTFDIAARAKASAMPSTTWIPAARSCAAPAPRWDRAR